MSTLALVSGMDGTGLLFKEFLSNFDGDSIVIPLPQIGRQDHASLANIVRAKLPTKDFVLLAESFAGGIVLELLKQDNPHLKGVIFVASFLSSPKQYFLPIAKHLPIRTLASAPFANLMHKFLLLGQGASKELLFNFVTVVKSVPEPILKSRLATISQQRLPTKIYDISAIYIQALTDRLISLRTTREFTKVFTNIKYREIAGPHFILQAKPKESARLITELMSLFDKSIRNS